MKLWLQFLKETDADLAAVFRRHLLGKRKLDLKAGKVIISRESCLGFFFEVCFSLHCKHTRKLFIKFR